MLLINCRAANVTIFRIRDTEDALDLHRDVIEAAKWCRLAVQIERDLVGFPPSIAYSVHGDNPGSMTAFRKMLAQLLAAVPWQIPARAATYRELARLCGGVSIAARHERN